MEEVLPAPTYEELLEDLAILQKYLRHVKKELKKAKDRRDAESV
jgi:hypothetical protein